MVNWTHCSSSSSSRAGTQQEARGSYLASLIGHCAHEVDVLARRRCRVGAARQIIRFARVRALLAY